MDCSKNGAAFQSVQNNPSTTTIQGLLVAPGERGTMYETQACAKALPIAQTVECRRSQNADQNLNCLEPDYLRTASPLMNLPGNFAFHLRLFSLPQTCQCMWSSNFFPGLNVSKSLQEAAFVLTVEVKSVFGTEAALLVGRGRERGSAVIDPGPAQLQPPPPL